MKASISENVLFYTLVKEVTLQESRLLVRPRHHNNLNVSWQASRHIHITSPGETVPEVRKAHGSHTLPVLSWAVRREDRGPVGVVKHAVSHPDTPHYIISPIHWPAPKCARSSPPFTSLMKWAVQIFFFFWRGGYEEEKQDQVTSPSCWLSQTI